jgi:hypothetical protein
MKLYLAGGYTGNLKPFFDSVMKIYLSGSYSRLFVYEEAMKLFLAGSNDGNKWKGEMDKHIEELRPNLLESYFYIREHRDWYAKRKHLFSDFMLDSGAFSVLNGKKEVAQDWDKYVEEYADFININEVDKFIELDIDPLVGLKEVERLKAKLEKLTNKQAIPVWHKSRGLDYWKRMISEHDYVAIGGIVTREIKPIDFPIFTPLLKMAKDENCKVHGLGFTNLMGMRKYKFDSVDSTAWLYGNRGGFIYEFKNGEMLKHSVPNSRMKGREGAVHNFAEWVKYSMYADKHL